MDEWVIPAVISVAIVTGCIYMGSGGNWWVTAAAFVAELQALFIYTNTETTVFRLPNRPVGYINRSQAS